MRLFHELDLCIWSAIVVFCCVNACNGQSVTLVVNASAKVAETDEHFICATLDYLLVNRTISSPSVPGTSLSLCERLIYDLLPPNLIAPSSRANPHAVKLNLSSLRLIILWRQESLTADRNWNSNPLLIEEWRR